MVGAGRWHVVDAKTKWQWAEASGGCRSRIVGGGGKWGAALGWQINWWVAEVAEWWAAEANGGGRRHMVNAVEANGQRRGGCRS